MKTIAKILMIDSQQHYLVLYLNNHPSLGNRVDIPGGTAEGNETPLEAMLREVREETGLDLQSEIDNIKCLYEGDSYTNGRAVFALYKVALDVRPNIKLSWEHGSYKWLPLESLIEQSAATEDRFMGQLVVDSLRNKI